MTLSTLVEWHFNISRFSLSNVLCLMFEWPNNLVTILSFRFRAEKNIVIIESLISFQTTWEWYFWKLTITFFTGPYSSTKLIALYPNSLPFPKLQPSRLTFSQKSNFTIYLCHQIVGKNTVILILRKPKPLLSDIHLGHGPTTFGLFTFGP